MEEPTTTAEEPSPAPDPRPSTRRFWSLSRAPVELLVAVALFAVISLVNAFHQPQLKLNDGWGWDGQIYRDMAKRVVADKQQAAAKPFAYRVATPYLAAKLFPNDLLAGFFWINLAGGFTAVVLLTLWLRTAVRSPWWRLTLLLLFQLHYFSPVRLPWFYAATCDGWVAAFLIAGLLVLGKKRVLWLDPLLFTALTAVGILFREVLLILPLVAFAPRTLARLPRPRELLDDLLLAVPALLAGIWVTRWLHDNVNGWGKYEFRKIAWIWYERREWQDVAMAWLNTFGPLLFLLPFSGLGLLRHFRDHPRNLALLLAFATLTWIAGHDMERFAFWAAPVLLVMVGSLIEGPLRDHRVAVIAALAGAVLIFRAFLPIPRAERFACKSTDPVLRLLGRCATYLELQYWHANKTIRAHWRDVHWVMFWSCTAVFVVAAIAFAARRRLVARN